MFIFSHYIQKQYFYNKRKMMFAPSQIHGKTPKPREMMLFWL